MNDNLPAALARQVDGRGEIAIRSARATDVDDVARLAELGAGAVPAPPVLLAESDGSVVVALSITTGDVATDPFCETADLVELLRLRSNQLHDVAA